MDTYGFGSNTRIRGDRNKYFSISVITILAFHFTGTAKKRSKRNAIRNTKAIARNKNGEVNEEIVSNYNSGRLLLTVYF